ncbi:MAG: hypothetical protein ACXVCY_13730 [Pseudobdellovibrionaceae bacterium]
MKKIKLTQINAFLKKIVLAVLLVVSSKASALILEDSKCQWKPFPHDQYKKISDSIYYEIENGYELGCKINDGKIFNSEGAWADIEMHNIPEQLPKKIEYNTCEKYSKVRASYIRDIISSNPEKDGKSAYTLDIEVVLDLTFENVQAFNFNVHLDGYRYEYHGPIYDRKPEKKYFTQEIAAFSCHK